MGGRILIVEDDPFIAMDLAEQLQQRGFEVIGPHANVAAALTSFETSGCDAAVLDINLGSETSEAVAERLTASDVPFVVLSGYSATQRPTAYAGAPAFDKPLVIEHLVEVLPTP